MRLPYRYISISSVLAKQTYRNSFSTFPPKANLVLLKFPFAGGQSKSGVEFAPDQLDALILHKFDLAQKRVVKVPPEYRKPNNPNSEIFENCKNALTAFAAIGELHAEMRSIFAESKRNKIIVIGGDHSMSLGSVSAAAEFHPQLQTIWVDAHADINIPEKSPSKNIHGMPVSFLLGLAKQPTIQWFPKASPLSPEQLFYIGVRDIDPWESWALDKLRIRCVSSEEFNRTQNFIEMLQNIGVNLNLPIHVSFDVDSLDPSVMPCTGTPVPHGLKLVKTVEFFQQLLSGCKKVVSMDVTESNFALAKNIEELETSEKTMQQVMTVVMENIL